MYVQHDFLSLKITIKYLIQRIYSKFTRICISKTASIVRVAGGPPVAARENVHEQWRRRLLLARLFMFCALRLTLCIEMHCGQQYVARLHCLRAAWANCIANRPLANLLKSYNSYSDVGARRGSQWPRVH